MKILLRLLALLLFGPVSVEAATRKSASPTTIRSAPFIRHPGTLTLDVLLQQFNATQQGLTVDEATARLARYGKNELSPSNKRVSIWTRLLHQFTEDRLVQILLLTAAVSAALADDWWEPGILVAILIVNSAMTIVQEQAAEKSVASLQKLQATTSKVVRRMTTTTTTGNSNNNNGNDSEDSTTTTTTLMINSYETVPGDIVKLAAGDKVPADCRILSTNRITADEASLTGESVAVEKMVTTLSRNNTGLAEQVNMVYAGTTIVSGGATALVVHTGMNTEFGKIQASLDNAGAAPPKTPLALQLETFGNQLSAAIGVICIVVWLTNIGRFDDPAHGSWLNGALYYFKVAVALGVAAIPEGLPAVIRLALQVRCQCNNSIGIVATQSTSHLCFLLYSFCIAIIERRHDHGEA
jgi:magnesium-transporting ATPase (P-type)